MENEMLRTIYDDINNPSSTTVHYSILLQEGKHFHHLAHKQKNNYFTFLLFIVLPPAKIGCISAGISEIWISTGKLQNAQSEPSVLQFDTI